MLQFDNITFTYRSKFESLVILRDFSLSVESGEVLSILGESGVGKSTILHLACGLLDADVGRITFDGKPIKELREGRWFWDDVPGANPCCRGAH